MEVNIIHFYEIHTPGYCIAADSALVRLAFVIYDLHPSYARHLYTKALYDITDIKLLLYHILLFCMYKAKK